MINFFSSGNKPLCWHAEFSRWRCRNLGGKAAACLHKPPVAVVETENIRSTETISNQRQHVYNYPCHEYDDLSHRNILARYGISIREEVWSDVKLKTTRRNLKWRNLNFFLYHSELLSTENENCYI